MSYNPLEKEACPLCGELNRLSAKQCKHCRYRLPWADILEGTVPPAPSSGWDEISPERLALAQISITCRYCEEPIEAEEKQCPHCKRWLVAPWHEFEIDPWQRDYDDKKIAQVDMIRPRASCLSVLASVFVWLALPLAWLFWRL